MTYEFYTDGSSRGNPGKGAFACVAMSENKVREYGEAKENVTNNQMEMGGVIFALSFCVSKLEEGDAAVINSDSQYVIKGINEWVYGWIKNGWKTSNKKDVLNKDLWEKMWELVNILKFKKIEVRFLHVKGHNGHILNERADIICTSFAQGKTIELYNGDKVSYEDFLKNK